MKKPRPASKIGRVGRKRRAAGWMLLSLGMLVAAVWAVSGWWFLASDQFVIGGGEFRYAPFAPSGANGWRLGAMPKRQRPRYRWTVTSESFNGSWDADAGLIAISLAGPVGNGLDLELMLWPIPLLLWTSSVLLFRSGVLARRRVRNGQCVKCGYSLSGLEAGGGCPECGACA